MNSVASTISTADPKTVGNISNEVALIAHQNREQVTDESETAFLDGSMGLREMWFGTGHAVREPLLDVRLAVSTMKILGTERIPSDAHTPETDLLFQERMAVVRTQSRTSL